MWGSADKSEIDQHPSPEDGWALTDGQYEFIWFNGPELPDSLVEENDEDSDNEY
jgi:hypothetical protein